MNRDFGREIFMALKEVMEEGRHASSVISDRLSSNPDWSDRKRALFSNTVYDIIRWWRLLWTALARDPSFDERAMWHLMGAYMIKMEGKVSDRPQYKGMAPHRVRKRLSKLNSKRSVRESIPEHLDRLGERELGEEWEDVLHFLNSFPPLAVRVNTLITTREELRKDLSREGYDQDIVEWAPEALVLKKKGNVFKLKAFQKGSFEVQDPASQAVSHFLEAEAGMRVIDACAGQGGKTLHLSAIMKNTGQIIAMDDVDWKLEELKKRAKRAGCQNIRTVHVAGSKSYKRMKGTADRILLDVPCTGLGALRRNPDIKWSISEDMIKRLDLLQKELLNSYSPLLKQGGKMVYATCSILPSEGEEQIRWFLEFHKGWELEEEKRLRPDREGFDGFYMARLINSSPSS